MTASQKRPFPDIPNQIEKIHLIGICGAAMGSLAGMLQQLGYTVRGSDANAYPPMSDWLAQRDISIMKGYDRSNLDWDPDLVIVGNVCRREYGDAVEMRHRELPYLSMPEALTHFCFPDKTNLVITGTHGKTTTSAMLAWVLAKADRDPSFMIGGITGNFGSNYRLGDGSHCVYEGDEYDTAYFDKVPKFWHYRARRATINNIEFDHADIYDDLGEIEWVFERFAEQMIEEDGSLWVNGQSQRALNVSANTPADRKTFGLETTDDLHATDISIGSSTTADVYYRGDSLGTFEMEVYGEFNVRNMLGATGIALDEGISVATIKEAFRTFRPVKKRQELIAEINGIRIFDDYAHHPTAVHACLSAMRQRFPERRIWAAFEAKTNTSRRKVFQNDYPPAFEPADRVILSSPHQKKHSKLSDDDRIDMHKIAEDVEDNGSKAEYIPDPEEIVQYLQPRLESGDIVIGISGGSFGGLHPKLARALRDRFEKTD